MAEIGFHTLVCVSHYNLYHPSLSPFITLTGKEEMDKSTPQHKAGMSIGVLRRRQVGKDTDAAALLTKLVLCKFCWEVQRKHRTGHGIIGWYEKEEGQAEERFAEGKVCFSVQYITSAPKRGMRDKRYNVIGIMQNALFLHSHPHTQSTCSLAPAHL